MDIQVRSREVEAGLRSCRSRGFFAFAGLVLLYAALLVPAIEYKPAMALGVTLAIAGLIPFLLRWHAWTVERRVLARITQGKA